MKMNSKRNIQAVIPHGGAMVGTNGWLMVSKRDGAQNIVMRLFEMEASRTSPEHAHPYEHAVYVLKGTGIARSTVGELKVQEGDALHIPAGEKHQLVSGSDGLHFICCIPASVDPEL